MPSRAQSARVGELGPCLLRKEPAESSQALENSSTSSAPPRLDPLCAPPSLGRPWHPSLPRLEQRDEALGPPDEEA